MATLAELTTERDKLQKKLDSGVDNIAEGDKRVSYRAGQDLGQQLQVLERKIRAAQGKTETLRVYPQASKGWG